MAFLIMEKKLQMAAVILARWIVWEPIYYDILIL